MFFRNTITVWYKNVRKLKHVLYDKHLGITNTAIGFILYGCGDLTGQLCIEKQKKIHYRRLLGCALWGAVSASLGHNLFKFMHYTTYKHSLHGQTLFYFLIMCPFEDSVYFAATGYIEGQCTSYIKEEMKAKFLPTLFTDVCTYYPFLYIIVRFVPFHLRVTADNLYSFAWSIFLSFMKHDVDNQLHQQICDNN